LIEDLGSSNGTFLNSAERRVTRATPLAETDSVYFGTYAVPAARLLASLTEPAAAAPVPSSPTVSPGPRPEAASVGPAIASLEGNRWTLALLAQAPILAVLIVSLFGWQTAAAVTASSWESIGHGIAATTFALAVAAVWLGCSLAVGEFAAGRAPGHQASADPAKSFVSFGSRLVVLCTLECAILLAIVYWGSGLKGPWLAMCGMLVMASLVGLLFTIAVSTLLQNRATTAAVLLACLVPMVALGGCFWRLPGMSAPVRLAAAAMPSRWAFEGLFLLETAQHRAPVTPEGTRTAQNHDLVEGFFPADSERMGPRADAMALGSMLIGLVALTAFISGQSRAGP